MGGTELFATTLRAVPLWAGHRWLCPVPPEMGTVHSGGEGFLHLPGPILRRKEWEKGDKEGSSCYQGQALILLLEQSARAAKGAGEQSWAQCPVPPCLQDLLATLSPAPRAQKFGAQLVTCCLAPLQPPSQREDPVAFAARVPGEPADLPDLPLGQKGHLRGEGGPGQLLRVPSVRDGTQAALGGELVSGMGEAEP